MEMLMKDLAWVFTYDEENVLNVRCAREFAYQARKLNDKMELNEECRYCGLCISVCKPKALGRKFHVQSWMYRLFYKNKVLNKNKKTQRDKPFCCWPYFVYL